MKVVLIYNPASGSGYDLSALRRIFKKHDVKIDYSFTVKQLSSNKLKVLIQQGVVVAAVGGDGTLNSAARLIVGTSSVLLPLPGGTFNHFIRDLGMPPTVEEVMEKISTAKQRKIDVAYVNDELFLNNSNLGLYPFSLIERKTAKRILGKWLAAGLSIFDQVSAFRRHDLVIDGEKVKSPFVFIGNNVFDIKDGLIPRRTGFARGVLTVMVASSRTRKDLFASILAVLKGDVSNQDDFTIAKRKKISIYSHRATIPVSFDGEVKKLKPPLHYRIDPKSLNVLVVKRDR